MDTHTYPALIESLTTIGNPKLTLRNDWPNYLECGLTSAHIPDLLRLLTDEEFRTDDGRDPDPKYWTLIHAWRALGQLRAVSVVQPLLDMTPELLEDDDRFSDWALGEIPEVCGLVGQEAIPILAACLFDSSRDEDTRVHASSGLSEMIGIYLETQAECVGVMCRQLEKFRQNTPRLNAFIILDLKCAMAKEALPLITRVFAADLVDDFIVDLDDVLIDFGLKEAPPRQNYYMLVAADTDMVSKPPARFVTTARQKHEKTMKARNKMAKNARRNRCKKQNILRFMA